MLRHFFCGCISMIRTIPTILPSHTSQNSRIPMTARLHTPTAMLGRLFSALKAAGLYQSSVIAMMADHGEAFGEHGERTHGIFLYDETIHVPLVVKLARGAREAAQPSKRETSSDARVGLVDVTPTLLDSVGIAKPKEIQGHSLLGVINGERPIRKARGSAPSTQRPTIPTGPSSGARCAPCVPGNIWPSRRPSANCTTRRVIRRR